MLRRNPSAPAAAAGGSAVTALRMAEAAAARNARSQFADRLYAGARDACSADERREAERRSAVPLASEGTAS